MLATARYSDDDGSTSAEESHHGNGKKRKGRKGKESSLQQSDTMLRAFHSPSFPLPSSISSPLYLVLGITTILHMGHSVEMVLCANSK